MLTKQRLHEHPLNFTRNALGHVESVHALQKSHHAALRLAAARPSLSGNKKHTPSINLQVLSTP